MSTRYLFVLVLVVAMICSNILAADIYNKEGNRLSIYGKLNEIYMLSKYNKNSDLSYMTYGFRGESKLGEGIIGFGTWEQNFKFHNDGTSSARSTVPNLGFIGIKFNENSSIDYGRNYGILHDVSSWTNILPKLSGNASIDNLLSGRFNGLITYRNTNFFGIVNGLNFAVQYQGINDTNSNNNTDRHFNKEKNDNYGLSVTYHLSHGAYASAAIVNNQFLSHKSKEYTSNNYQEQKNEAYALGLKYDLYNLYLAAIYSEALNNHCREYLLSKPCNIAKKENSVELAAQYQFDFGLRPAVRYQQLCAIDNQNNNKYDAKKYFDLGASYNFNRNMMTFIDYHTSIPSKYKNIGVIKNISDSIFAIGISYMF